MATRTPCRHRSCRSAKAASVRTSGAKIRYRCASSFRASLELAGSGFALGAVERHPKDIYRRSRVHTLSMSRSASAGQVGVNTILRSAGSFSSGAVRISSFRKASLPVIALA